MHHAPHRVIAYVNQLSPNMTRARGSQARGRPRQTPRGCARAWRPRLAPPRACALGRPRSPRTRQLSSAQARLRLRRGSPRRCSPVGRRQAGGRAPELHQDARLQAAALRRCCMHERREVGGERNRRID